MIDMSVHNRTRGELGKNLNMLDFCISLIGGGYIYVQRARLQHAQLLAVHIAIELLRDVCTGRPCAFML